MFGLGVPEIIVIGIVVLLIFGPTRLPQLGTALGKTIRGFRKGMQQGAEDDADEENAPKPSK
jgi:sec-independent protein translocase protein TatA